MNPTGGPQRPAPQHPGGGSVGSPAGRQPSDPLVQRQVLEHGLGTPIQQARTVPWWWAALGLVLVTLVLAKSLLDHTPTRSHPMVIVISCLALLASVGGSWFFGRRPRAYPVLLFENGLVFPNHAGELVGARWEELRIRRKQRPNGRGYDWLMFVPGGQWTFQSNEIPAVISERRSWQYARAQEVVRSGGEWNFSGWRISREGLRVASGAYRWDQIEVELHAHGQVVQALSPNPTPKLTVRRLGDNLIIDELQTEDADAFLPIAGLV